MGQDRNVYTVVDGKPEGKNCWWGLVIEGRITLIKMGLKNGRDVMDWNKWFRIRTNGEIW